MRILPLLLLLTLTLSCVWARKSDNNDYGSGPDDALCSSYSGPNSTCSSCLIQGCTYCDMTGTGRGGLCLSHKTAHDTCNTDTTLISSFSSLTQCRATQHDLYENMSAFIPITTGLIGIVIFLVAAWFVRPDYAPSTPTTEQQVLVVSSEGHEQPLLGSSSRWLLIKQQLTRDRMRHHCRSTGWCYRIFMIIILIIVFALSIVAVSSGMWSIQIDSSDKHGENWDRAESAIAYDGYGMHTITRDPHDHDKLILRYSRYQCNTLTGDNFIRCSLHRILASVTQSIAIIALVCIVIVMLQMLWSLIRCRSLNNTSVKFMSLTAISHLVAVMIYAGGCYLLQSRVYHDTETTKQLSSSPQPYHLFLGVNWNVSVAAFVLNVVLLIPLTRAHIHAIPKPDNKKGCCCRKQQEHPEEPQNVTIAVPMNQPSAPNPSTSHYSGNPYAAGATSYMSPSYQYGAVAPVQPAPAAGQPLRGFTNEI